MAIFLVIIRFWKDRRQAMWENIVQKPSTWLVEMIRSISLPPLAIKRSQGRNVDSTASSSELTVQRFKENLELINDVLYYWFGQYPPDTAQKMLWMIASSSKEHQKKVDQEIADKFETLLWELSADQENGKGESVTRWKEWCLDLDGIYGVRGKIAAIVVLDQFSRHILRHRKRKNSSPTTTQQSSLDHLALRTAQLCVECHAQEIHCGMVSLPMYIFALMPYRHTNTMDKVHFVQQCIEEASCLNAQLEAMLGRFRKATNRRMALLQDEARRTGKAQEPSSTDTNSQLVATTKGAKRHDEDDIQFTDDDILETFPFEADLKLARNHPIHTTIVKFLADQGIHSTDKDSTNVGERKQKARREIPSLSSARPAAVAVSLSGGVDSMVIASVLSHLQKSCGYQHLHIVAVHIDYANRPESGAEAAFVERYCRDYLGSIDFMCRRIGEVTRGITAREDYERIARTIRYEMYRDAVAKAHTLLEGGEGIVGVMLGHHRGDLRENVLSNAHKGCGPLDLSGMTSVSKNDGIVVYRPLLPLEKSFVLDYAHKFGVPYFKDTTPHWSTRGKLRNKLLPLLEDIYGDGSMNNLSNLAVESDECRALLQQSIIGPFMDAIVRKPMGIILDTAPWKDQPDFFWKFVLREALHSASLGMFSDKSVLEFLKRVKADTVKSAWLQCRKDYGVYLQDDGKAFVLYPSSFPWNKKDVFGMEGQSKYHATWRH
jgi:tRNA(Ile)-lysidine synthetase-like protein